MLPIKVDCLAATVIFGLTELILYRVNYDCKILKEIEKKSVKP